MKFIILVIVKVVVPKLVLLQYQYFLDYFMYSCISEESYLVVPVQIKIKSDDKYYNNVQKCYLCRKPSNVKELEGIQLYRLQVRG